MKYFLINLLLFSLCVNGAISQEALISNDKELWFVSKDQKQARLLLTAGSSLKEVRLDKQNGFLNLLDENDVVYRLSIPDLQLVNKGWHYKNEFNKLPKKLNPSSDPSFSKDLNFQCIARYNELYILTADFEIHQILPIPNTFNVQKVYWIDDKTLLLEGYESFVLFDIQQAKIAKEFPLPDLDFPVFELNEMRDTLFGMESEFYGKSTKAITSLKNIDWAYSKVEQSNISGTILSNGSLKRECDYFCVNNAFATICNSEIDTVKSFTHLIELGSKTEDGDFWLMTNGKTNYWDDSIENSILHFFDRTAGDCSAKIELPKRISRWGKEIFVSLPKNWKQIIQKKIEEESVKVNVQKRLEASAIYFSDQGNYFVTDDQTNLTVWETRSMRQINTIPCKFYSYDRSGIQIVEARNELACKCKSEDEVSDDLHIYNMLNGDLKASYSNMYQLSIEGFSLADNKLFLNVNDTLEIRSLQDDDETLQKLNHRLKTVAFNAKSNYIVGYEYGPDRDKISWIDLPTEKSAGIKANKKFEYVSDYELSSDGKHLLLVYPYEGDMLTGKGESILEIYNTQTKKKVWEHELMWGMNYAHFSPNGDKVYFLFYDTIPNEKGELDFAIDEYCISKNALRQVVSLDPGVIDAPIRIKIHPTRDEIIYSLHDQLYRLHLSDGELIRKSPRGLKEEYKNLQYNSDTKDLFVRTNRMVQVLNLKEPSRYAEIMTPKNCAFQHIVGTGLVLWEDTLAYRETEKDYSVQYVLTNYEKQHETIQFTCRNEVVLSSNYLKDQNAIIVETYTNENHKNWVYIDLNTGKELGRLSFTKDYRLTMNFERVVFSEDFSLMYLNLEDMDYKGECHIYQLDNGFKKIKQIEGYNFVIPTKNENEYLVQKNNSQNQYNRDFYLYDVLHQKEIHFLGSLSELSGGEIITQDNQLILTTKDKVYRADLTKRTILQPVAKGDAYFPLQLVGLGDNYAIVDYNGFQVFNPQDELEYQVITSAETGALFQLPSGHYFSPELRSLDHLNFVIQGKAYPYDELDLTFNRPDIVMRKLKFPSEDLIQIYEAAHIQRLERQQVVESKFELTNFPTIHLVEEKIDFTNYTGEVDITYECLSRIGISRLNVWVNNVPIYGKQGIAFTGEKSLKNTLKLKLSAGLNRIQLACTDINGNSSMRSLIEVENKKVEAKKPKRVIISIACSDYANPKYNLNYAVKDGNDILSIFSNSAFEMETHSFFNEDAVRSNLPKIRELLMNTDVDDQVILFLSGHGVLDKGKQWWFATHDIDFASPEKAGIRYEEWDELLDGLPSRNKLLLMDACNSGEVDESIIFSKDTVTKINETASIHTQTNKGDLFGTVRKPAGGKSSFNLMKDVFLDISRGSGTQVIAAASGNSFAYESPEFKNGVFTYALREALTNSQGDVNGNGTHEVLELKKYVESLVLKLTEGKQRPTARQENLENNFRIK